MVQAGEGEYLWKYQVQIHIKNLLEWPQMSDLSLDIFRLLVYILPSRRFVPMTFLLRYFSFTFHHGTTVVEHIRLSHAKTSPQRRVNFPQNQKPPVPVRNPVTAIRIVRKAANRKQGAARSLIGLNLGPVKYRTPVPEINICANTDIVASGTLLFETEPEQLLNWGRNCSYIPLMLRRKLGVNRCTCSPWADGPRLALQPSSCRFDLRFGGPEVETKNFPNLGMAAYPCLEKPARSRQQSQQSL